jgi:hypothetical protein
MSEHPAEGPTEEFVAVMVRQYTIGSVAVLTDGWGNPGPPTVAVGVRSTEIVVTDMPGHVTSKWIGDGRTLRYSEIKTAQAVINSRCYLVRGANPHEIPFGVRLQLGESRSHMLLFTVDHVGLIDALASHHVSVDRNPRKLAFLLLGKK